MSDEILTGFLGGIVLTMGGVFILGYILTNTNTIDFKKIDKSKILCEQLGSELKEIYMDYDFLCRNGVRFSSETFKEDKQ
jgi:hypothetical protein